MMDKPAAEQMEAVVGRPSQQPQSSFTAEPGPDLAQKQNLLISKPVVRGGLMQGVHGAVGRPQGQRGGGHGYR